MHSRFYAGLPAVFCFLTLGQQAMPAEPDAVSDGNMNESTSESPNVPAVENTAGSQMICGTESLKFEGPGVPGIRDFLRSFSERHPDPQIAAWLGLKNLPETSPESVQYPPEDDDDDGEYGSDDSGDVSGQTSEFFTARVYDSPEQGRSFALSISYTGDPFAGSFCFFRYDAASREFVPDGDFPKRRYDGFRGLHYRYLIRENGGISLETFFMYDKNGVPLYSLEQVFDWNGSGFQERPPTLYTGRKLLSPGAPDGKWDRLALHDIDGDNIPELFLSRSDTGAGDVFYGNGRTDRLSGMKTVPVEFLVTDNGLVTRDASGLNSSYTVLRDSAPDGVLTVSCRDVTAPETCTMRLNGSRITEDRAAEFMAGFSGARELSPDFIVIQGVVTEEVSEDDAAPPDVAEEENGKSERD